MAMDLATLQQQLPQLEFYCERLYTAQDPNERKQAEESLTPFGKSTDYIPHLRTILDNSNNPYAQYFASSSLLKMITEQSVRVEIKLEIRNYFLGYLESKGPTFMDHHHLITSLVTLIARITKLCWFAKDDVRTIVTDAKKFLGSSPQLYQLGLLLLKTVVQEMHQHIPTRNTTHHRKTTVSFRDLCLLDIFATSLEALRYLKGGSDTTVQKQVTEISAVEVQALELSVSCLSFDFVGTSVEDWAEDVATLQIPGAWRSLLEDLATLQLFTDYYFASTPPLSPIALECLVRCASVRRSLFGSEETRVAFLAALMNVTLRVLQSRQGLEHQENYHEFCRLLGRLRSNFQLSEIVSVENYEPWITAVANFTVSSLQGWQMYSSSVTYLLQLWTRLVSCAAYLKSGQPNLLADLLPQIISAYVQCRLDSVQLVAQGQALEDPLDNEEHLQEQLESLPYLCRFQSEKMSSYFCSAFDARLQRYTAISQGSPPSSNIELQVVEGQITWFVHMIGAIIKGRLTTGSTESQEVMDGELAARVLSLLKAADSQFHLARYGDTSRQRLDIALLTFFQHFRKVYVGEVVMHSSKVYERLRDNVGIDDHLALLNVILTKVIHNLKTWSSSERVIEMTLTLFKDLTGGYMSGKVLSKLDAVSFMLANHSPSHYTFLASSSNTRNRTTFYATLARMIFMEDSPAKFVAFVKPLKGILDGIAGASVNGTNAAVLRQNVPVETVIGLFRDLYGIAQATVSRRAYMMLFQWLYGNHFPPILACLEAWSDTPAVTTPLLKFLVEFVSNKGQCMAFDTSSPNGILLFREISKVLVIFSTATLSRAVPPGDVYSQRYKGISLCLAMLSRALNGSYVNFGVFELYNDAALQNALEAAMKMALSIHPEEVLLYSKLAKSYFVFLEALCHNHHAFLVRQPHDTFARIMRCLELGVKSLDVTTSSQCAMAIDNLATWVHQNLIKVDELHQVHPAAQVFAQHVNQSPNLLPELLQTLLKIALFQECFNQWSLSRPMLSLILLNQQNLSEIQAQLLAAQPAGKQEFVSECLEKLMKDVDDTLSSKNRDRFTQNLTNVRQEFKNKFWS